MCYDDRLKYLQLESLSDRRKKFDLTMCFKIIKHYVDLSFEDFFAWNQQLVNTRGHSLRLFPAPGTSACFFHSFRNRVLPLWNALPESYVNCATLSSFKNVLSAYRL